jgi:hypothetical protein
MSEEGVLRKDHLFASRSDDPLEVPKEIYRFTYQRFSDHLVVEVLLREQADVRAAFQAGGGLRFLVEHDEPWALSTLWTALAVQIPEEHPGVELPDLIPEVDSELIGSHYLEEAFKQSILWRDSGAFSDGTLELFNAIGSDFYDPRLEILIQLSTLRDHPWNARNLLDPSLRRRSMPERDALWTVRVNNATEEEEHPVCVLIEWCLRADLTRPEMETLELAATVLCWLFTSSSRRIRDRATKALISVITAQPAIYPDLLRQFVDVDDLYVGERVCAAGLGAVCRGVGDPEFREISHAVYQAVFLAETPPLNINLRDYARAIIEFAAFKSCLREEINLDRCRPPYRSTWPLEDTTEEDLERVAEEAGSTEILSSAFRWGDFARYEIEPKVHHFSAIPLTEPRPLNREEKEKAFKEQLQHWSERKQRLVSTLEHTLSEMKETLRVATPSSGELGFRMSYAPEAVEAVERCETESLAILNDEERGTYEQLAVPAFFPDRIPAVDRELPRFDVAFSKRWVARRAYEYGWNAQLFPNDHGQIEMSSRRPSVERIGKNVRQCLGDRRVARSCADLRPSGVRLVRPGRRAIGTRRSSGK